MYYAVFDFIALSLFIIINFGILFSSKDAESSEIIKSYRLFSYSIIAYFVTDIIWAILLTFEARFVGICYIDTVVCFLAMALSVWLWTEYIVNFLHINDGFEKVLLIASRVMFILVSAILLVNVFYPILFIFDENGAYRTLGMRGIFLGSQIFVFVITSIYTIVIAIKSDGTSRIKNLTVALSGIVMTVLILIQTFDPFLPFYSLGGLLATTLIHTFVVFEGEQEKNRELEIALEEAERANAAKSIFLSNMSHEIRTPISAILGLNEIICRDYEDEKLLSYAFGIQNAGTNLLGIINEILDFSKIEAGKMSLILDEYNVSDTLSDLYNLVRFRAEGKGLVLKFEIDPNVPQNLVGDELRIKQVLTNLLTNAVKYTEKGSVTLKVNLIQKDGDTAKVKYCVSDTGIGIKEDEKGKLFEAFDRLDLKRTRTIEGTGLGLSITSSLLRMMDSQICVDSTYNVGSDFYFELTQKIADENPIGEGWRDNVSAGKHPDFAKRINFTSPESRILIVDDTPLNIEVICGLLEPAKMQIDTANSGAECIEKFGQNTYDFVFLDYLMPQMDGIETLAMMKEKYPEKAASTPIISLTANAIAGEREHMINAGFTDYLTKPINLSDMIQVFYEYLPKDRIHVIEDDKEEEEADTEPLEGIPAGLSEIPWLDVKEGVEYCGTADLYLTTLGYFAKGIEEKATLLEDCMKRQDIVLLTITIHSIKSTSLTVGMTGLSAKAREIELAGKDYNIDRIRNLLPDFLEKYRESKKVTEFLETK